MLIQYNVYDQLVQLINADMFKNQIEVELKLQRIMFYVALEGIDQIEFLEVVLVPLVNKHRARKQIKRVIGFMFKDILEYV